MMGSHRTGISSSCTPSYCKMGSARAKLNEYVSTFDLHCLNRNKRVCSLLELVNSIFCDEHFSVFFVEPLRHLHLRISQKLNGCTVGCQRMTDKKIRLAQTNKRRKGVSSSKSQLFNGCNYRFSEHQNKVFVPGVQVGVV